MLACLYLHEDIVKMVHRLQTQQFASGRLPICRVRARSPTPFCVVPPLFGLHVALAGLQRPSEVARRARRTCSLRK